MKRNSKMIALVTAFIFMFSVFAPVAMTPADAASDNKVSRVITVSDDVYTVATSGEATGGKVLAPALVIENDDNTAWDLDDARNRQFRLALPSGVKWNFGNNDYTVNQGDSFDGYTTDVGYTVRQTTDRVITVVLTDGTAVGGVANAVLTTDSIVIPLLIEDDGMSTGEIRVTVDARDSRVTSGSYTFAQLVTGGKTVTTVASSKNVSRGTAKTGATVIVDEVTAGALTGNQKFRLRLPNGFEWNEAMENSPANYFEFGGFPLTPIDVEIDERDITVEFAAGSGDSRRSLVIKPLFDVTRSARQGDVTINISSLSGGDITNASGLLIAKYSDYAVTVEIDEVEEFLAGRYDDGDYLTGEITVEESVASSLSRGQVIEFELPRWAKVMEEGFSVDVVGVGSVSDIKYYDDRSAFEISVSDLAAGLSSTDKLEFSFELPLTFSANAPEGDVELTVKGAGVPEQTIVVAKVKAPVVADVNMVDVRIGVQGQSAPEIFITETEAGAIQKKSGSQDLVLAFAEDIGFRFDSAKFEVVEGDLEIDQDNSGRFAASNGRANTGLEIAIKAESDKASTIRIYDIKMTVDRTAPEGPIKLDVKGNGIVQNMVTTVGGSTKTVYNNDFTGRVARFDFANVITAAPGEIRTTSVFTVGSLNYSVLESGVTVEKTMDAAPYNKAGRVYLPVRFVADALGVAEDNIVWNANTKQVTIFKGDRIVQMTVGSTVMTINGATVAMDAAPEIVNGRTFLPIRFVSQALGAQIDWDQASQSVTVTQ